MIKQISRFLYLLIIFLLLLNPSVKQTGAFLDDDLWINLYKILDESFEDLDTKQYEYEIAWWEDKDLSKNINRILNEELEIWKDCINSDIDSKAIKRIANWDIYTLWKYLNEDCFEDEKITIENLNNIATKINEIDEVYIETSKDKSKKIYDISRVSLYTDWTTDNSPFDLINDLQSIADIAFNDELIYEWEDSSFLSNFKDDPYMDTLASETDEEDASDFSVDKILDIIDGVVKSNDEINEISLDWILNIINDVTNTDEDEISLSQVLGIINDTIEEDKSTDYNSQDDFIITNDWNIIICPDDNSVDQSWLDISEIIELKYSSIENIYNSSDVFSELDDSNEIIDDYGLYYDDKSRIPYALYDADFTSSSYNNVNDSSKWPCNEFFCIKINFATHNQKLFSYWDSISLENLVNTSNGHLKKGANTSLQQAKMSTNNFELWLRDLNLPDTFHMWFVIQKKSPPLYNLENVVDDHQKHLKISETENMLEETYKNLWLDYSRSNDLDLIIWKDKEEKTVIDWANLAPNETAIKDRELKRIDEIVKERNDFTTKQLDKVMTAQELEKFYDQLIEIERSVWWIEDYTISLNSIIRKMREIPIFVD